MVQWYEFRRCCQGFRRPIARQHWQTGPLSVRRGCHFDSGPPQNPNTCAESSAYDRGSRGTSPTAIRTFEGSCELRPEPGAANATAGSSVPHCEDACYAVGTLIPESRSTAFTASL